MIFNKKINYQSGFTLIEIIIAVMILAMSLTTLLALQTSAMNQALRTRNAQEAMLASRSIMSGIEFAGDTIVGLNKVGTVVEVARTVLKEEALIPMIAKQQTIPMNASLTVEPWTLPKLPQNSMLKVTLIVSWSNQPQDQIKTYYFTKAPPKP
jgi:prepilin-type N-terminal cleavage/methylation domain-containing protein